MKHALIYILIVLSFSGCSNTIPNEIKSNFTNCFQKEKSKSESPIELGGYYLLKEAGRWCSGYGKDMKCYDTFEVNMLFYPDGTFLDNFFNPNVEYPGNTKAYLEEVYAAKNDKDPFYEGFYWGSYRINGDTITVQCIHNSSGTMARWIAYERQYKIVNRTTIESIPYGHRSLYNPKNKTKAQTNDSSRNYQVRKKGFRAEFVPVSTIPPPNSWLKKQSWMWCDGR